MPAPRKPPRTTSHRTREQDLPADLVDVVVAGHDVDDVTHGEVYRDREHHTVDGHAHGEPPPDGAMATEPRRRDQPGDDEERPGVELREAQVDVEVGSRGSCRRRRSAARRDSRGFAEILPAPGGDGGHENRAPPGWGGAVWPLGLLRLSGVGLRKLIDVGHRALPQAIRDGQHRDALEGREPPEKNMPQKPPTTRRVTMWGTPRRGGTPG